MAVLPPYFEDMRPLRYDWFPTRAQCFIYRNWEMLSPARLARVLSADEETVCRMAADMGLGESTANEGLWLTRGYVTLIRANWHLLTYPQLCTLLGWDEERLAFMLKEDDFLDVKLGRAKPCVPTLAIEALDGDGQKRTAAIRRVTEELRGKLPAPRISPFAFSEVYPKDIAPLTGRSRLGSSYLCAYEALYGDIFYDDSLIEASFPDALLSAYAALGVGQIVCQAVLYSLIPCPYAPELSEGWERRIEGLRRVIARFKKHGLKLLLYINEPRELPDAAFHGREHLRGDVYRPGYASLCLSVPEAQDFLRDSIKKLTELAPGIGGYSVCTASENHTNCYSHKRDGATTCPRCVHKRRADLFALTVRLIAEGAHAADPDIAIIAASWAWDQGGSDPAEVIDNLPPHVAVWAVSEHGAKRTYEDVTVSVADYSIEIPGPAPHALSLWAKARAAGLPIAAKIQLGNSWELSTVPYIPVFGHFYRAIRNLCEQAAPEHIGLTWTMGSFPSPVFRMFSEMTREGEPIPDYEVLIRRLFPNADGDTLLSALRMLDDAFDSFPFSIHSMYNGPQHMGPALPLWREDTGWRSCMVGPIYDDMRVASDVFGGPFGVFLRQYEKLCEGWQAGLATLQAAYKGRTPTEGDRMLLRCAEVAYLHFTSARNHLLYIRDRDSDTCEALIRHEEALALREAALMAEDPTVGFEATNHYFYTRTDLFEKVLCCRHLLGEL